MQSRGVTKISAGNTRKGTEIKRMDNANKPWLRTIVVPKFKVTFSQGTGVFQQVVAEITVAGPDR